MPLMADAVPLAVALAPLLLTIILLVAVPILAWRFGLSVGRRVLIALAVSGLVITSVGVAIFVGVFYIVFYSPRSPPQPHSYPGYAILWVFGISLVLNVEALGSLFTLASCFVGLRQTAQSRSRWFWALLVGALISLILFALSGRSLLFVVLTLIGADFLSLNVQTISAYLLIVVVLPLTASIIAFTYARQRARGMRRSREQADVA